MSIVKTRQSLEARWADIFRDKGAPQAILACTFTFCHDFFDGLLEQFKLAALEAPGKPQPFAPGAIDVICDGRRYNGSRAGYNVHLWPQMKRLFHPKLLLVRFDDEIVWSDGSLNLTRPGWFLNRELAMIHRSGNLSLPAELIDLLNACNLPEVIKKVLPSPQRAAQQRRGAPRFVSSLKQPIGPRFLERAPPDANAIHIIAPFFERGVSPDQGTMDEQWLMTLLSRYPDAAISIYLPALGADLKKVQGHRALFEMVSASRADVRYYPVPPEPGPLHAKGVVIEHGSKNAGSCLALFGSPNMTKAALLDASGRGNIEVAWIVESPAKVIRPILASFQQTTMLFEELEFVEPKISGDGGWFPLKLAEYDPGQNTLRLTWRGTHSAAQTEIRYAGKLLDAEDSNVISDLDFRDERCWLDVGRKGTSATAETRFPITIDYTIYDSQDWPDVSASPDELLARLGSIAVSTRTTARKSSRNATKKTSTEPGHSFQWSERVRDLSHRMHFVEIQMRKLKHPVEVGRFITQLLLIAQAHKHVDELSELNVAWFAWVRLEIWHTVSQTAPQVARAHQANWASLARKLHKELRFSRLPTALASQFRTALAILKDSA